MANGETRGVVRSWVRAEIAGRSSVSLPDLCRRMVEHFAGDEAFVAQWLAETMPAMAYDEVQSVCGATRGRIVFGDEILSRDAFEDRVKQTRPRWQAWLEHVGDRHVRLMEMGRSDLLAAAAERERRGAVEYRYAALWREMAVALRGRQTVGDRFSEAQIEQLAASLAVRVGVTREIVPEAEAA